MTKFSGFQVEAIKEPVKAHPNGRFCLKVDTSDIKVLLQESVKGKWDGDIDLGDGKLQEMQAEYDTRKTEACIKGAKSQHFDLFRPHTKLPLN